MNDRTITWWAWTNWKTSTSLLASPGDTVCHCPTNTTTHTHIEKKKKPGISTQFHINQSALTHQSLNISTHAYPTPKSERKSRNKKRVIKKGRSLEEKEEEEEEAELKSNKPERKRPWKEGEEKGRTWEVWEGRSGNEVGGEGVDRHLRGYIERARTSRARAESSSSVRFTHTPTLPRPPTTYLLITISKSLFCLFPLIYLDHENVSK